MPLIDERPQAGKATPAIIERADLQSLFDALDACGYLTIGPTVREGAIVYEPVHEVADLPIGWTEEQAFGTCRLVRPSDQAVFAFNLGPKAWTRYPHLSPARLCHDNGDGPTAAFAQAGEEPLGWALLGVRSRDLLGGANQDRAGWEGRYRDHVFAARRRDLFIVALHRGRTPDHGISQARGSGLRGESCFDLALTEVLRENQHYFLVEIGSDQGAAVLDVVPHRPATCAERAAAYTPVRMLCAAP